MKYGVGPISQEVLQSEQMVDHHLQILEGHKVQLCLPLYHLVQVWGRSQPEQEKKFMVHGDAVPAH